ncbi:uncharacterized protein B0P05DRAFT_545475 [Gilbertella persicaria]|uniref:uncharacterized protein n=1 Tax=Gilbertella persicaria TaxID=101096 RepID=UPI00221ED340|nr:uncharacterized protein B0P05DRAFT_545475 [Gilbertella persicaria]KAI8076691.1 hypothetical protein B0P05DRAFT_545475 [Gilbertella persicaria]
MQFIENTFGTGRRPPFPLLLALINFILKPKSSFKKIEQLRNHWRHCKRAHAILLDVLTLFGPEIYHPLWNQFKYFELISTKAARREEDDDYDQLDTQELKKYRDFWNFADRLLNREEKDLDAKCRRLVLDFFVNVLQTDLKLRLDNEHKVEESIFVKTLDKDTLCRVSKFNKYLSILMNNFPNQDEHLFHLTGDILNMFITIACFDRIAIFEDLVTQVYSVFAGMDTAACQQFFQLVKYPSFIIALCDKALADVDVSKVKKTHRHFRNTKHVPLHLEKLFYYVLRTQPHDKKSLESIYRHVAIVSKYCMCVFSTATVNQKRDSAETNTAFPEKQLELLVSLQHEALEGWEVMIENLVNNKQLEQNLDLLENIRWSVKLTVLSMTEYF